MREHRLIVCCTICILLFLFISLPKASCQNYFEYNVKLNSDGSVVWAIIHFSSVDSPVDSWESFQEKIFNLVDSAESLTHREMEIDEDSIQISSTINSETKIIEYSFIWQNCSAMNGNELLFGDVFDVNSFFSQLYGDAALELSYPSDYSVKSVSPSPNERQDSAQTLKWARTHDLVNGATVILTHTNSISGDENFQYGLIVVALAVVITVSLLGFFAIKRRRNKGKASSSSTVVESLLESEEDKILKLLKTAGGSMRQSDITERCRFSKAKTSQLLTALENSGIITRYKKGRDKIVTLKERVTGE